ncbi:MAG: delta-aminolevulinic acid dehydratase [Deltaproteobacteria bacterium RIFOXYA12_FULL_61_11]|nr:MAG: delta-aminolevulinic acid dehydratase [Deltaproteobacteria bacterium RIFOXYA12_FULL_61_11]
MIQRPRRLRRTPAIRELCAETDLTPRHLVQPLFVVEGKGVRNEIPSMPGCYHLSVDQLGKEVGELATLGLRSVILFGLPGNKDEVGSGAYDPDGIIQRAVKEIKDRRPATVVITDVCLCEYTSHGHCGLLVGGQVDNDASLELLARTARSHAQAGADLVAPSDMMDGRVAAIRDELDASGFSEVAIMAYSAKYASAFYGPFRDAARSAPQSGDRRGYQMDFRNGREALKEIALDLDEGADIVMVKPALCYLDLVRQVRDLVDVPVAAYNVSGEYTMVVKAIREGLVDERIILEVLFSIRRAGADIILTYFGRDFARLYEG